MSRLARESSLQTELQATEGRILRDTPIEQDLSAINIGLILIGDPLITAVLNQHRARRIVRFSDMVICGYRRLDFYVRENTKMRVSLPSNSIPLADVSPEVEEKARAALEATAEVTVFAQIDFRVENSGKNPAVLEKIVCRRWLFGAVGQGTLRGQPRNGAFRADDSGGGESRACRNTEDSPTPSSNSTALRVSGLNLENSSSVSIPAARNRASIVRALERFGSLNILDISRSRCSMILKISR